MIIADYLKSGSLEKESNLVNTAGNYSELVSNFKSLPKDKNVCFYLQQAERGRRIMGQASNWPLSMRGLTKSIIEPSSANYNKELIKLGCRDLNMPVYGKLSVGLGD